MNEIFLATLVLALVVWAWMETMEVRALARVHTARFCKEMNWQFLDQSVAFAGITLLRLPSRGFRVCRRFRFEFSEDGRQRQSGVIFMLGRKPSRISAGAQEAQVIEEFE